MLTHDKTKSIVPVADKDQLRRELLRLILKNEAQRKAQPKTRKV